MARYIDAEIIKNKLKKASINPSTTFINTVLAGLIDNAPTADVAPKTEVIEEFANRLKERLYTIPTVYNSHFGRMIDEIAKDMKGD
jgi:hypothetical protein